MADKFLSFLGLCRKAGKMSIGHDAALESIMKERAKLCVLMTDASDRLKAEFAKAASYNGRQLEVIHTSHTMAQLKAETGIRAGVITIDDDGFAKKTAELHRANHEEDSL